MVVWYSTESDEQSKPAAIDGVAAELRQRIVEASSARAVGVVPCWVTEEDDVALAVQSGLGVDELELLARELLGRRFHSIDPLDPLYVMLGSEASEAAEKVLRKAFRDGSGGYTTGPEGVEYVITGEWLFVVFALQDTLLEGLSVMGHNRFWTAAEWWRRTWIDPRLVAGVQGFAGKEPAPPLSVAQVWQSIERAGRGLAFSTTWWPLEYMLKPWKVEVSG